MFEATDKVEVTPLQKTERICEIIRTICFTCNYSLCNVHRVKVASIFLLTFSIIFLLISLVFFGIFFIISLCCLVLSILLFLISGRILKNLETKRMQMVASVLNDNGVTELYTVGTEHKIYTASFIDVDILGGEVSLILTELEKVPLDCIFVDKIEAAYYLYNLEKSQQEVMGTMIGEDAVNLLYRSKPFALWMKEYLNKIHYFTRFYKHNDNAPVLATERDFSGYLSWLYKNKLTETRTAAAEYEQLIKGILKYSDYIGGCCLICNSGNCELRKRY